MENNNLNYTKPNDPDHIDSPEDWLNSALIFSRVISLILDDKIGVVIDLKGEMFNPIGESNKLIVYCKGGLVHVDEVMEDFDEGTFLEIKEREDDSI